MLCVLSFIDSLPTSATRKKPINNKMQKHNLNSSNPFTPAVNSTKGTLVCCCLFVFLAI